MLDPWHRLLQLTTYCVEHMALWGFSLTLAEESSKDARAEDLSNDPERLTLGYKSDLGLVLVSKG
jgi:hypothetical protein